MDPCGGSGSDTYRMGAMPVADTSAQSGNGDFLFARLTEEVSRAARHDLPLSLMLFSVRMADASNLGLDVLTRAAVLLTRSIVRDSDVVASVGYGHFAVVANAAREGATVVAESVARELQAFEFTCGDRQLAVEVRYGVASLDGKKTAHDLFDEARAELELQCPSPEFQGQC